jgi:hypothetical protein
MNFINHIIEPTRLFLSWRILDGLATRYIVAELYKTNESTVDFKYLTETEDFRKAQEKGFVFHTAFQDIHLTYYNVLDTFTRRIPPRKREDFSKYLAGLRLKGDAVLSDFALLGYSGAKLLSDSFSIIHPFDHVKGKCELFLEVANFKKEFKEKIEIGMPVSFLIEPSFKNSKEKRIQVIIFKQVVGEIHQVLVPSFFDWLEQNRIECAVVEKVNGTLDCPNIYLYVAVLSEN